MITEDERFIHIQGILAFSDIHPTDCIKINDLIIELSKENTKLKERIKIYEDPEDLTLMFMYCDEKAKDKIKDLK